jgi:hypothetical protein
MLYDDGWGMDAVEAEFEMAADSLDHDLSMGRITESEHASAMVDLNKRYAKSMSRCARSWETMAR